MAVISLSITESDLELVAGIPTFITISANIPSTIFYTLDGSVPTTSSLVAMGEISLPTDINTVTVNAFATNGIDTSSIITWTFGTSTVGMNKSHATVSGLDSFEGKATFPFGSQFTEGQGIFGEAGGVTVDAFDVPGTPSAVDADGDPAALTDKPYNLENYEIIFSETDAIGQMGRGIGTLPETILVVPPSQEPAPESSDANDKFFNPRALVIFQDSREAPYDPDLPQIMRPYFDTANPERVRYGAMLFNTALESGGPTGSALKQHYNPRDNTITYYYRDSETGRWIISKTTYTPKTPDIHNLAQVVFGSRGDGSQYVFRWIPFHRRVLT